MTKDFDGEAGAPAATLHFVLKRGHKGRFRFALTFPRGRMTGEVWVADQGKRDRSEVASEARCAVLAAGDVLMLAAKMTDGGMSDPTDRSTPSTTNSRRR